MRDAKANKNLEKLISIVDSEGIQTDKLIKPIQEIREIAKEEKDPLVTRALRLAWQHIEANESFNIPLAEEIETETENLSYFLSLCIKNENDFNREDLREMTNNLQELA
ncbi:MAG: hypothetical protein VXX46_04540 [Bacteroidota bacterium]|nr:hypothetical protein [Bacteroidota bacterium]